MMEALSREFRVSSLWELLPRWKTSLKSHGLHVNVDKTKILVLSAKHNKISARNPKYPYGVYTFGVGANSILCTSCDLWVHNMCSGITDCLTDNRNFVRCKCSREIVTAAIASFKVVNIGNDGFHVESSLNYLDDKIGQCGGCSDAVSTHIISSWKAFGELLLFLTKHAIQTKLKGNAFNMYVRKMLLYGSEIWPVVTEDVQ